jgi:hypothetical protein
MNWVYLLGRRLCIPAVLSVLLLTGAGCAVDASSSRPTRSTLGQELVDLKKARDAGALTEQEYETERQWLLNHH